MIIFDRDLLTQAAIIMGLCVGAQMLVIAPRKEVLAALEAANKASQVETAQFDNTIVRQIAAATPLAEELCWGIEQQSTLSSQMAQLFEVIMEVAGREQVEVRNLRPTRVSGGPDAQISVTRIDIVAVGAYARLAAFTRGLDEIPAFIRAGSVQNTPSPSKESEKALLQIGCDAVSFTIPDSIGQLHEGGS